jgi:RNA recognition motif-containing protein
MKLYIGNLDEKIQDIHLKEAFSDFGKVASAKVITDRYTRKSRGFGFVEMPDEDEALKVIKTVNGSTWEGKVITVRKAFDK